MANKKGPALGSNTGTGLDKVIANDDHSSISADVINLRSLCGDRFKIGHEAAYHLEYGANARIDDPWYQIVPCKHGHVFPFGGPRLAASTSRRGAIANKLLALSCVSVEQDGSDGVTVSFCVSDFDDVVSILQPRRRRSLSREHRAKLSEAGLQYRFVPTKS